MTQHAKVRAVLEERLKELTTRAERIDEDLSQTGDDDWDENAIESAGDEVLEGVGHAAVEEMRHIKAALTAIEAGTYGTCSECGVKIARERLEALPEATRCRNCA